MDTKAHYTLIGILVVMMTAALITGILWLSVGLNQPTYNTFLVNMDQSITGLNQEAPVKFNGVSVGYVKDMALNPKNPQQVILTLQIEEGTPITTSTVATLAPQGITGLVFINLSATTPNAPLVKIRDNPPYPFIPSQPSLLLQLSSLVKDASSEFQGISTSVQNVLNAQNAENLQQILINLKEISGNLATNSNAITAILNNTAEASAAFPQVMTNFDQSMINLNQTTTLAKEAIVPAVRVINNLDTITGNLDSFSADLKENPAILIRGKAEMPLGPGE
jgi:phospholipid/cholesterol/gamma-HCH transport system substrate-binding protein